MRCSLASSLLGLACALVLGCSSSTPRPDAPAPDAPPSDAPAFDVPSLDAPALDVPTDAPADASVPDVWYIPCHAPVDCDDGLFCTDDVCRDGVCTHPPRLCADDDPCTISAACDESRDACVPTLADASVVCRNSRGPCDIPELCSGTSPGCPPDRFADGSVACRPSEGPCNPIDHCSGLAAECPADVPAIDGTECDAGCGLETCMGGACVGGARCGPGRVCLCDTACGLPGDDCP